MALDDAYTTTVKIFNQVSQRYDPQLLTSLKEVTKKDILVVRGDHDHVETLLGALKIPHTMTDALGDVNADAQAKVAFVNCKSYDSGYLTKGPREFVERGGRLVTSDWALGVVTHAFPGTLRKLPQNTEDDVVEVQCPSGIGRRLIGMHYAQCHPSWWLESASHLYTASDEVIPLLTSEEQQQKYGSPLVAVGFTHGDGEVLHFISHFVLQRSKQKGTAKGLDDFLTKMGASKTDGMKGADLADLEAAYSSLNTIACLCAPRPILRPSTASVLRRKTT